MKKTLFLAVFAGAVLAGCVKNEEVVKSDGSPERITFDAPVVGVPTRATEIYGNYPGDRDFAVYALYHTGSFSAATTFDASTSFEYMTDVQCKADNTTTPTTWNPVKDYYWPKGENAKLTFGAYAPSTAATVDTNGEAADGEVNLWPTDANVDWGKNGFTFTNFTVDDEPEDQIDLLYSNFVTNQTKSTIEADKPYDGVTIPFKHALSSIVFTASTSDTETDNVKSITIKKITVKNIAKKGNFVQEVAEGVKNWTVDYTALHDYEVYNNTTGKLLTGTSEPVNGALDPGDNTNDSYHGETGDNVIPVNPNNTNDGKRRSDLIVIPQKLKGGAGEGNRGADIANASVEITYTIVYVNPDDNKTKEETNTATFKLAVDGNITDTTTYEWEMGKRYVYNITIGLYKIYFNPKVTNWDEENGDLIQI